MNSDRTGFVFEGNQLKDHGANGGDSINEIVFGAGFGGITYIEIGPDGMMYIVSIIDEEIYRIVPNLEEIISETEDNCQSNPKPRINWAGCDLSQQDFSNEDLAFADLSNTNILNTKFNGAGLTGPNLTGVQIVKTDFRGKSGKCRLKQCKNRAFRFSKVTIANGNLMNSEILESNFSNSIIRGSNFQKSVIEKSNFNDATLYHSNLKDITIINSDLTNGNLKYSKFNNAILDNNILREVDMSHAQMTSMKIDNTEIKKAIMTYVNFSNSVISNSNFEGSYPYSSDFSNTKISKDTKTDTCLNQDIPSRAFNKILREIREYDSDFLKPIEFILVELCRS